MYIQHFEMLTACLLCLYADKVNSFCTMLYSKITSWSVLCFLGFTLCHLGSFPFKWSRFCFLSLVQNLNLFFMHGSCFLSSSRLKLIWLIIGNSLVIHQISSSNTTGLIATDLLTLEYSLLNCSTITSSTLSDFSAWSIWWF